jgi:hypothetical protein
MLKEGDRRGQITVFIIIAIVIVAVALFIIFLSPRITDLFLSEQRASQILASQVEPLRDSVADCVSEVSKEFFDKIGENGGYYDAGSLPRLYLAGQEYVVVMYKDTNRVRVNKLPLQASIELQYREFLEQEGYDKIDECLNDFSGFKRTMGVEPGPRTIDAEIKDDFVLFNVNWPITIKKTTITKTITKEVTQKFATLTIPFGKVWRVADDIVECEVQVDCDFEGEKIDQYVFAHPETLKHISFTSRSITENNIAWILETEPYRGGEEKYMFYFGIMREPLL